MANEPRIPKASSYEPPTLKVVGTVHELTLSGCKSLHGSDGFYLMTPSVTLGSC